MTSSVRTVTACVSLTAGSGPYRLDAERIAAVVAVAAHGLQLVADALAEIDNTPQTLRMALPKFHTWCTTGMEMADVEFRKTLLNSLDQAATQHNIQRIALGTIDNVTADTIKTLVPSLIQASPRFSVAVETPADNSDIATALAEAVITVSKTTDKGLGNFRLCGSSCVKGGLPFFPGAVAPPPPPRSDPSEDDAIIIGFALGLENGGLLYHAINTSTGQVAEIGTAIIQTFTPYVQKLEDAMRNALAQLILSPGPTSALSPAKVTYRFLGIDTSANPGLQPEESVAAAVELVKEVQYFGGPGTIAAASAITRALQALPVPMVGYCGLMLPVCEDARLAELCAEKSLSISHLLSISSVCGVGVDTVPVAGDVSVAKVAGIILDVAALAHRWNKPLTCRLFPVPSLNAGNMTDFQDDNLVDTKVLEV